MLHEDVKEELDKLKIREEIQKDMKTVDM